ncbi:glycoside hydrolase family 172 protein [Salinimicrobium sp. TIG7-5_MAKvit]|uniref:glycoside hydrolase family 172 protein n=1 Tax=Salinimicrobium sp. TIG7-5_MAKvit TaxID=3121289 RepID=UPI003C6E0621
MKRAINFLVILILSANVAGQDLYKMPKEQVTTKWVTFENLKAEKGAGGMENRSAKGHAFERLKAGESVDLVNFNGSGIVNRIWLTISDRSPQMLRSLKIEMFWDGEERPAVSVPLGDFFGIGLGTRVAFESALFADPEGRSFNCFIPMPFKEKAVIRLTNDSQKDLNQIFYEINLLEKFHFEEDILYFHAYWSRDLETKLGEDFVILPQIEGKGRFLGTNIGIFTNELYQDTWWGEGEVKIHIDGDNEFPSLVGSGTEDYVGTAYGQGTFTHQFQGSPIVDVEEGAYAFYRYHIPDPVFFYEDIKVSIQQIGGAPKEKVQELVSNGARLIPVSVDHFPHFTKLLELDPVPNLRDEDFPQGWTNFYRSDDVSATAYFYLDRPGGALPQLQPLEVRTANLSD